MRPDDAQSRQTVAALPDRSTWLMANAGSGKTRVLTDRVARLLLQDVEPQRILCLTYTKAAASEMQNRLFKTLGSWAMMPEAELRQALASLGEAPMDSTHLARARRLFARAIETPGGLRIQTIHSFCATLLRRFPLEAGVPPRFGELDERASRLMQQEILEEMASGPEQRALEDLAREFTADDFPGLIAQIVAHRALFRGNRDGFRLIDFAAAERELARRVVRGVNEWFGELLAVLAKGSDNDLNALKKLNGVDLDAADAALLRRLESAFLTSSGANPFTAKVGSVPTKPRQPLLGPRLDDLNALMLRVEAARQERLSLQAMRKTAALHGFARAFLPRYQARKADGGWLDFDDLIARATDLVTDPSVAAWVLYRLDGGIDHVLVDEAQDTSPGQWRVIELLTAEFTAGQGARDEPRTLFVVGDQKQSIYSFQGADVAGFTDKRALFRARFEAVNLQFQSLKLEHSFRSSPAILSFVDATLAGQSETALGPEITHIAFRPDLPGRVDLWPLVPPADKAEKQGFEDPVDQLPEDHHVARLADQVAREIAAMLKRGDQIHAQDGVRPVRPGDFLILVQSRSGVFKEVIRACKKAGLPMAGADRMTLVDELAVKDLLALLSFLDTPDDDLSLAALLRSPLGGVSEAELFDLAHGRKGSLWEALQEQAARFAEVLAFLADMRAQVDFLRPYDLLERVLIRHDGRRRLVARLGDEAEEAVDELLNQALAYERAQVPSLTGFLIWLSADEVEVKRQAEAAGQHIRVMTVHGAKGLEAEIVILPDTADRPDRDQGYFYPDADGGAVWKPAKEESPIQIQALRQQKSQKDAEERLRLFYVATTRARCWLIVAGAGKASKAESWYALAEAGMARLGAAEGPLGLRHETGFWPSAVAAAPAPRPQPEEGIAPPHWASRAAPPPPAGVPIVTPSGLGGAKVLPGDELEVEDADRATEHGSAVHLLLQHLCSRPELDWERVATHFLGTGPAMRAALAEASAVLRDQALAPLFAAGQAEVALSGRFGGRLLHGVVDRLLLRDGRLMALDYKTNAAVPDRAEDIPEGLLRQLGAYRQMLGDLHPGQEVDCAILWTKTRLLMPVHRDIVRAAWQRATRDWG